MHNSRLIVTAFSDLTYRINGAAMAVHRALGAGLKERSYSKAFALELASLGIQFTREVAIPVTFREKTVGILRPDYLVEGAVVVELKAVARIEPYHEAQLLTYVERGGFKVGLLLNFGTTLEICRKLHSSLLRSSV